MTSMVAARWGDTAARGDGPRTGAGAVCPALSSPRRRTFAMLCFRARPDEISPLKSRYEKYRWCRMAKPAVSTHKIKSWGAGAGVGGRMRVSAATLSKERRRSCVTQLSRTTSCERPRDSTRLQSPAEVAAGHVAGAANDAGVQQGGDEHALQRCEGAQGSWRREPKKAT